PAARVASMNVGRRTGDAAWVSMQTFLETSPPQAAARLVTQTTGSVARATDTLLPFRPRYAALSSRETILYLKLSGSRGSIRPSAVSACGYIRNGTVARFEPGSFTSCA